MIPHGTKSAVAAASKRRHATEGNATAIIIVDGMIHWRRRKRMTSAAKVAIVGVTIPLMKMRDGGGDDFVDTPMTTFIINVHHHNRSGSRQSRTCNGVYGDRGEAPSL
jgi:hypothetical protein